jgi:ATP-binding cassette subfamily C protein LapB
MATKNIIQSISPEQFKNFIVSKFLRNFENLSKRDIVVGLVLSSLMINTTGLMLPFTIIQMYDRVIPNKSYHTFTAFMVIVMVVLVIEAILKIMRGCISSSLDVKLGYSMNLQAYKNSLHADLLEFNKHSFGVQVDRFNLINSLKEYYSGQYFITLCDVPFIIIYFTFIYYIQVYVGLAITTIYLIMLAMSYLHIIKLKQDQVHKTKSLQVISKFLIELLGGISTVKSIALEEQMLRRYEKLQKNNIGKEFGLIQEKIKSRKNIALLANVMIMSTVFVGCLMIFQEQMTLGGLAACILLSGKIMQPVANVIVLFSKWNSFVVANQEHNKLLDIY